MMPPYRGVIFDLDGTLTPVRSVWRHIHERLGLWDGAAREHQSEFEAGLISYEEFCARDAAHWAGMSEHDLRGITDGIPYRGGARECVSALRDAGYVVGIVSTGLTLLADRVHGELELAFTIANRLVSRRGRLTGAVKINVEHDRKEEAVELFCRQFGIAPPELITVGDSDGDISMFRHSGFSIAVRPASDRTAASASVVSRGDSLVGLLDLWPAPIAAGGRSPEGRDGGRPARG